MENGQAPSQQTDQQQAKSEAPALRNEPFILLYGRNIDVIQVLCDELVKFGRQVAGTDDHIALGLLAAKHKIDFIVVGAGLPEKDRLETVEAIEKINPNIPVHLISRSDDPSPYHMIDFTNRKAVEWKVQQVLAGGQAPKAD